MILLVWNMIYLLFKMQIFNCYIGLASHFVLNLPLSHLVIELSNYFGLHIGLLLLFG